MPIVPGKPEESEIIRRIFAEDKDDLMPPVKAHKELTAAQKETMKRWVAEGAKYEVHWAYAPLAKPPVPTGGQGNPVDGFILARRAEKKIAPSPEAPAAKLLRRLSLDLTGLPPTPEEVAAFLADDSPEAFARVIDRLLASPHYGQRWGRHWLDVARYADSNGLDENLAFGSAWRYRDYVIESFNRDRRIGRPGEGQIGRASGRERACCERCS